MRILVLTSVNPVLAGFVYNKVVNGLMDDDSKDDVGVFSYPAFAQIESEVHQKEYLPTLFSMLKVVGDKKIKEKIYEKKHTIIVGNTYKNEKFDFVVCFRDDEGEVFDTYIETLQRDEEAEKFNKLLKLDELYTPEDADINIPTIWHLTLFLKETIKNEKLDRKRQTGA